MIRTYAQSIVEELAQWADIPVINGLSDLYHPCQMLADLFTIQEYMGGFQDRKIAFIGDGNNVANSWLEASILLGLDFSLATPEQYGPDKDLLVEARKNKKFFHTDDPSEAVKDADVIYTDVWVSMGQEAEKQKRIADFKGFQINAELLKSAAAKVKIMHCLPAYRGLEITDEAVESENSIIFDQAENRLHAQQALLAALLGGI